MELLTKIDNLKRLWAAYIPPYPAPDERQLALWARRFNDAALERAFWRTGQKFEFGKFTPSTDQSIVFCYTTGLLLNLEKERQQHSGGRDQRLTHPAVAQ